MGTGLLKDFTAINASKANFDDIYIMPDPRAYFSILGALDYIIPDLADPVVRQILTAYSKIHDRRPRVLDVGCSYGINAAVHRFPVNVDLLRRRYASADMAAVSPDELMALDKNFFESWPDIGAADFIGLDISDEAVNYAKQVGLLRDGIVANLEQDRITAAQAKIAGSADVILSTGCIGYVSEKTYTQLLNTMSRPPWIISFVLRMFSYNGFEKVMQAHGLVTERLASATFVQRRFRDQEEMEKTVSTLARLGIDPSGFEADGMIHAELYLSRPAEDVRLASLDELVTVTSGRNRLTGARYVRVETADGPQVALAP